MSLLSHIILFVVGGIIASYFTVLYFKTKILYEINVASDSQYKHVHNSKSKTRQLKILPVSNDANTIFSRRKIGHKSRKFYIDLGANYGDTIEHFFNPRNKSEDEGYAYNYEIKGMCTGGDWNIVALEANPAHTVWLQQLKALYMEQKKVKSFQIINGTAIHTK